MRTWLISLIAVSLLVVLYTAPAAGLTLVKDGKQWGVIVAAAEPSENARIAAADFQKYIEKMSGVKLPILTDEQVDRSSFVAGTGFVLIGQSKSTEKIPGLTIATGVTKDLREEGFVIHCKGDLLVLAGNDTFPYYGTQYAVYELLNRLGCRWYLPGEYGEIVPKRATIEIAEMSISEKPDFAVRTFWTHSKDEKMGEDRERWKIRNKMSHRSVDWFGVPGDGSVANFMPKKQGDNDPMKDHPEWYALRRDGTRDPSMPCMADDLRRGDPKFPGPRLVDHFVDMIKAQAKAGARTSSFGAEDGMPRCYCELCQKIGTNFDGYGANDRDPMADASISTEWFHFVDTILKEVNKEYPDHLIATNGYANRDVPPEMGPDFNTSKNLVVMFANICACTIHSYDDPHCWQMQRQADMLKQWGKLCDKVWIYNYNYTMLVTKGTLTPMVHRVRRNYPLLKQYGLIGFMDQDEADMSLCNNPTHIVRAALMWNTKADVDAILDDYFTNWFGAAAKPMSQYYAALEDAFEKAPQHGHEDIILPAIYTPALMAKLDVLVNAAEKAAATDSEKLRVKAERLIFSHLQAYVSMEHAKQQCRYDDAAQAALQMVAIKDQLNQITPYYGWVPYGYCGAKWESERMQRLAGKTKGPEGAIIVPMPSEAKFRTDIFDDGRYKRWMDPALDDAQWQTISTAIGWENQKLVDEKGRPILDAQGHPYRGVAWYRFDVELPAQTETWTTEEPGGPKAHVFIPAITNEAWVWVNGGYVGHRAYTAPWFRPHELDMDISKFVKPGLKNQVTVRVLCNFDVFGSNGIYERGFIYSK